MLNVFRDNLKRLAWVLWIVIAVFVLLVFTDYRGQNLNEGSPQSTAATVGSHDITFAEYQQQYRTLEDNLRANFGADYNSDLARQLGIPTQALNQVVAQKIFLMEAEKAGLQAIDEEVRDEILSVPVFLDPQGRFVGRDEYQDILRANRLNPADFERGIRQDVLVNKFRNILASTAWVSSAEAEKVAREEADTATIRYLKLQASDITDDIEVSDDELASFFAENTSNYNIPESRSVAYLSVNTNTVRATIEISDDELRTYYDANTDEFTQEEQVRARHILLFVNESRTAEEAQSQLEAAKQRVAGGEDFAEVARELSEDEATAERGGELGFFGRGRMTPSFEDAAFGAESGTLVGPIENQLGPRTGYHLIEVLAKREGGLQAFEEVSNRIRVRLLNDRARTESESKANEIFAKVGETTFSDVEALRAVAQEEGIALEQPAPFTREDSIPGIGRATPFANKAFELDPGEISEPIRIAAGWAMLTVLEVEPPRAPTLDEVRDEVLGDAREDKKATVASQRIADLRTRLDAGETFESLAEEIGQVPETAGPIGRTGGAGQLGIAPDLNSAVLALEQGQFGGPVDTPSGTMVFEVTERNHFDPATFEEQREQTTDPLRAMRMNNLLQSFIEQRRTELDVTMSPALVENFELQASTEAP